MKWNQLLLKKAEMISSARKSNRSNPFIIYDYYNLLENMFQDNPDLDADRIYNCDESGFPNDQTNGKSITVKGIRAFKLSFGALDPSIKFKGKNLMKSWFGTNSLQILITVNLTKDGCTQRHLLNGLKIFARISRNDCGY